MEHESFNPMRYESSGDKPDDSKDSSKKKKKAKDVARLLTHKGNTLGASNSESDSKKDSSFWQELVGEQLKDSSKLANKRSERLERDNVEDGQEDGASLEVAEPSDKLTNDEQLLTAKMYIANRLQELMTAEASEGDDPIASVARKANLAFLRALQSRLAGEGADSSESPEEALSQQLDAAYSEALNDFSEEFTESESELDEAGELSADMTADAAQEFSSEQPVFLAGFSHKSQVGQSSLGGGKDRSNPPPVPGLNSSENSSKWPPIENQQSAVPLPTTTAENASYDSTGDNESRAELRGLVTGGILGYLIGRRRGRIKTEKRLHTLQRKLEKEVTELQQQVSAKEMSIQRQARQSYNSYNRLATEASARPESYHAERYGLALPLIAEAGGSDRPSRPKRTTEAMPGSASRLHETVAQHTANREVTAKNATLHAESAAAKPLAELNRQELLELSSQIKFGESNLRRVFDAQLVNEMGLRRLVQEYYAGHDLRRSLAREFLAKELRFERDPRLHDTPSDSSGPKGGAVSQPQQDVSSVAVETETQPASQPDSVNRRQTKTPSAQSSRPDNISPLLLLGLAVVTIALAIYAIWLTVER